jgi:hypothetical protein
MWLFPDFFKQKNDAGNEGRQRSILTKDEF